MKSREVWMVCHSQNEANTSKTLPLWRIQGYKTLVLQHTTPGNPEADLAVWCDQNLGSPASFNYILDRVLPASADLVVLGSDCLVPDQSFLASEIADQFFERFPDGLGILQPLHATGEENENVTSCASPFLGRGWIERAYGGYGALHTRYAQYFAGFELYWVAKSLGLLLERFDIRHAEHSETTTEEDTFDRYLESDFALLQQRVRMGFPGSIPSGMLGTMNPEVLTEAQAALDELMNTEPLASRRAA